MPRSPRENHPWSIDWRGWLALTWALWWFQAYLVIAVHARSARFLEIIHGAWK